MCRSYVVKQSLGSSKNYHWYFDAQPMIKRLKGHLSPNSYIFFRCVMISMSVKDQITEDAPLTPSVWILWWELTFSQCISVMQSAIVSQKCKTKNSASKCVILCRDHINVADVRPDLQVTRLEVVNQRKAAETAYRTLATPMRSA